MIGVLPRMVVVLAAVASPADVDTPAWVPLLAAGAALAGALGAQMVQGAFGWWNASKQREHELALAAQRAAHDLDLKRLDSLQTVRVARHGQVRLALEKSVETLLEWQLLVDQVLRTVRKPPDRVPLQQSWNDKRSSWERSALVDLVLDERAAGVALNMIAINDQFLVLGVEIQDHEQLLDAQREDASEHGRVMFAFAETLTEHIQETIVISRGALAHLGEASSEAAGPIDRDD